MKRYDWCSFTWDPEAFPDPKKYLADIKKEYNVKVCAWINPYIAQRADIFKHGCEKGYFLKRPNGSVWQWSVSTLSQAYMIQDQDGEANSGTGMSGNPEWRLSTLQTQRLASGTPV